VGIDPSVTQERPPPAHLLDAAEIDLRDHDRLAVPRRFRDHRPERIREERRAPELDAVPIPSVARSFMSYAVDGSYVATVGDGMAALDRAPGVELLGAVRRLLIRMPADGSRIEQHGGALQRREPRALGIPLIPAYQGS